MSAQSWRKFLHNMCGGILVIFSYSLYNKINFPLFSAKGTIVIFFFCTLLLSPLPQGRELKWDGFGGAWVHTVAPPAGA